MQFEVIVVGGGIGGLTTAALLAARGANVCLLEKEPRGGGCAVTFPRGGYMFEAGPSLYASWEPGEIHDRVSQQLPVAPPEVRREEPSYVVRLPDGTDVEVSSDTERFLEAIERAFPECAREAVAFYKRAERIGKALRRVARRAPDLLTASGLRKARAVVPDIASAPSVLTAMKRTAGHYLQGTSLRFRRFIDVQLEIFGQRPADSCAFAFAAVALQFPRTGMYAIKGGASGLADRLTDSIKASGGLTRFNSTVLRLTFDSQGKANGAILLSGETIGASRAVISNLTVWDTYGKLVGHERTPPQIRSRIKGLAGWGAYVLYIGISDTAAQALPGGHILNLTDWQEHSDYQPEENQFMFGVAPHWDPRGPADRRAVTVSTFTEASQWFAFQERPEELELADQAYLEKWWSIIHRSMPEISGQLEVIETATPRSFYDYTRRRLGMVGGLGQSLDVFGPRSFSHRTPIPGLLLVGDTTFPGQGVAGVTQSALIVANELVPPN